MGQYSFSNAENGISGIERMMETSGMGKKEIPFGFTEDNLYTQDYTQISNMLVTGTTGSGKTSFVQTLMTEMMQISTPSEVKFIVFDSKQVDYAYLYNNPYMIAPVLTDVSKIESVLRWLKAEVSARKKEISLISSKPHIFVIFDDFYEVSNSLTDDSSLISLLQEGRRLNMHYILVSSTPSNKIISAELKANLPYKIAFHTATKAVSRMIIDEPGAELLSITGEIIYIGQSGKIRCQSVYLEPSEIEQTTAMMASKNAVLGENILQDSVKAFSGVQTVNAFEDDLELDVLFCLAGEYVISENRASIGSLQRKFRISFNRAARIMDQLYEAGVIGPEEGTKPRAILMSEKEFECWFDLYGDDSVRPYKEDIYDFDSIRSQKNKYNEAILESSYNRPKLRSQSIINGKEYDVGVCNNEIKVVYHFKSRGHDAQATVSLSAEKIIGLIIKKSRLFSSKSYIQFVLRDITKIITPKGCELYGSSLVNSDPAMKEILEQTKASIDDGVLTVPYAPKDYSKFKLFITKIAVDLNMELREI